MSDNNNDSVEELAKRLSKLIYVQDYYNSSIYAQKGMLDLAREVKIIEIEARLDEVTISRLSDGCTTNNNIRKSELERQLNTLKGSA